MPSCCSLLPDAFPYKSMSDAWWRKWHTDRGLSQYFGSLLPVLFPMFHTHTIIDHWRYNL
jgi:hypothetical protein